jgi:uncharacterized protein YjbI with pentapeptide repeats
MSTYLNFRSPTVLTAIGVAVTLATALTVVFVLSLQPNGAKAVSDNAALIAALIALGGVFTAQTVSIALDQRRTQHEALQAYLAKMSELLLDKNLHEKRADYDATRVTARLQTLTVLERLDAGRKRTVLMFLREAQLINRYERLDPKLGCKVLFYAHYVGLRDANLSGANLRGARLISTSGEDPISVTGANLKGANLSEAILRGADLSDANLSGADLSGADLSEIYLRGAALDPAKIRKADLSDANLGDANLCGANLSGVTGVTNEELEQQAKSLEGAIMPDGSKHP